MAHLTDFNNPSRNAAAILPFFIIIFILYFFGGFFYLVTRADFSIVFFFLWFFSLIPFMLVIGYFGMKFLPGKSKRREINQNPIAEKSQKSKHMPPQTQKPVRSITVCVQCSEPVQDSDQFCPNCGLHLN